MEKEELAEFLRTGQRSLPNSYDFLLEEGRNGIEETIERRVTKRKKKKSLLLV